MPDHSGVFKTTLREIENAKETALDVIKTAPKSEVGMHVQRATGTIFGIALMGVRLASAWETDAIKYARSAAVGAIIVAADERTNPHVSELYAELIRQREKTAPAPAEDDEDEGMIPHN